MLIPSPESKTAHMRNSLEISLKPTYISTTQCKELELLIVYAGWAKQFNIVVDDQQITTPSSKEETGKML